VGQGNKFGLNKVKRNISFSHGEVSNQRENSQDFKHHDDSNMELGTIKLKLHVFQGKNDPKAYLEWEKKLIRYLTVITTYNIKRLNLLSLSLQIMHYYGRIDLF
jgi:hypothetical protein